MTLHWRDLTSARRTRLPAVRGAVARERLLAALDARVLLVTAPAGYGKTTALAGAATGRPGPVAWLTLDGDDADPLVLAASLSLAVQALPGGARPGDALGAGASPRRVAGLVADVLDSCGALLVLDEAQVLSGSAGTEVLGGLLAPGEGRLALLSRTTLELPELARLEVSGDAARLSAAELAFTPGEIAALFAAQGLTLTGAEVRTAHAVTEGWPIAARFLAQAAAQGRVTLADLADLEGGDAPLGTLFTYLAQEVLGPLDPALRGLLTRSSVFEELIPALLEDALDEPRARTLLETLAGSGTFLTRAGEDTYRAHPLLRAHLRGLLPPAEAREIAARGAAFFERTGRLRRALAAHLLAGNTARAAALLAGRGGVWLAQGRVTLVDRSLARLPRADWTPALHALAGDALRLASRYDEARAEYARAGALERALGEVRLALDTVQPALAWGPLDAAAALVSEDGPDPQGAAELRRLRAENLLNAGQLAGAVALEPELRGGARYALRSGDLDAALARAQALADGETGGARAAQNHREGLLLASFVHAARGEVQEAAACARRGLTEGERLESPFVQALALARLGHAQQAAGEFAAARESYGAALRQAQPVAGRLRVEPLMGLAALAGRAGDVARAQSLTAEARGQTGGDSYMAGLLILTSALGLAQGPQAAHAIPGLREAAALFGVCGDAFGQAAATLALFALDAGPADQAAGAVAAYPFLLGLPSLLAPVATRAGRAALLARLGEAHPGARGPLTGAARLLGYAAVPDPADTPGFEVRVQVLGRVSVTREDGRVREWGRAKARDLLALLAVHPAGLPREAAQEALFPDADPGVGERNFRVTLHALGQVLEEGARSGVFLERGDWLRLRPGADLHVDVATAWARLGQAAGTPGRLDALLELPPALADVELEDVAREAERYAAALPEALAAEADVALALARPDRAALAAGRALSLDPAHEPAARALMRAQHALGRGAAAGRVYAALTEALADLGLKPLPDTQALWQALSGARA
ncbi:BTAD domain-containing putative transcriptional regulator [Deinococcus radiotolerans]|uniref:Transcriptional activator n=1 Tax=Deinococcus radiotolerans TaxID=1309407 RepID=A0ABQ2FGT9_9DEIO|nr:BTAD domain-containing putative transcriptional regulator [Deinococcus radiotolerans]GGK93142.1 transcriptional activator [Deinococcus radiotolerans]